MILSMKDVNEMDKQQYVKTVGAIFEHSPWVAELAWEQHPFTSLDQMYEAMVSKMYEAEQLLQLSLLRAHPDLGTRLEVSESSKIEQLNAGLSQLTEEEYRDFYALNQQYTEKFGFPFIMAVKGNDKYTIQKRMKQRVDNDYTQELETALKEVSKIARFRLLDMINEPIKQ